VFQTSHALQSLMISHYDTNLIHQVLNFIPDLISLDILQEGCIMRCFIPRMFHHYS